MTTSATDTTGKPIDVETLKAFMEAWGINKQHMADAIGISKQSMNNKLSDKYNDNFTPDQLNLAHRHLVNMRNALVNLLAS